MSPAFFLLLPLILVLQDDQPPAIERLGHPDAAIRRAAERELAESGAAAVPSLRRALARETEPIEPRVDALVKKLAAASWKEREEAGRALVRLGRAARPRLQTHENSADVEVAWRVKAILAELKELEPGEAAAGAWRDAAICRLLGAAGDGGSAGLILGALAGTEGAPAEGALDLRLSVLGALADLRASITAEQAERATEEGLKLVAEPRHRRTMSAALRSLGRLKSPSAAKPLAALVENVSVKDLHVKRGGLAALAALGTRESMRSVIDAFKSADPYLREAAWQVLQGSGFPPPYDPESGPASDDARARIFKAWELQLSGPK